MATKHTNDYDTVRRRYRPAHIKMLLIAESPPPAADMQSSRHFYRSEQPRTDDRLFTNTIRALYPQAADMPEAALEQDKETWLRRFQADGWYMIEALEASQQHEVTKKQRQARIGDHLPRLLERVRELAAPDTRIILIKSNVYDVAAEPLRAAGFYVLNTELVDYPGRFNQKAYREKLARLAGVAQ
jgi:hypothetical protein